MDMAWFTLLGLLRRWSSLSSVRRASARSATWFGRRTARPRQARLRVIALEAKLSPTPATSPLAGAVEPASLRAWTTTDLRDTAAAARISIAPLALDGLHSVAWEPTVASSEGGTHISVQLASWSAEDQAGIGNDASTDPQNWSIFPASEHLLPLGGSGDVSGPVADSGSAAHFGSAAVFLPGDVAAVIGEFGSPVHSTTPSTGHTAQPGTNQLP